MQGPIRGEVYVGYDVVGRENLAMSHRMSLQCYLNVRKDPTVEPGRYEDLEALIDLFGPTDAGQAAGHSPLPNLFPNPEVAPSLLVVEDEPTMAALLRERLMDWGYPDTAITPLYSGEEAIAHARAHRVDIALVDIKLSNPLSVRSVYISGLHVIRAIKENSPNAKIILISGFATYGMVREAILDLGASYFLKKPFRMSDMLLAVYWAVERIRSGAKTAETRHGPESVLVVDDDDQLAESIAASLQACGYRTMAVPDGAGALRLLKQEKFDAVLLDVRMPQMNGLEVLRSLRQWDRDLIVVMLTAVADEKIAAEARPPGSKTTAELFLQCFLRTHSFRAHRPP